MDHVIISVTVHYCGGDMQREKRWSPEVRKAKSKHVIIIIIVLRPAIDRLKTHYHCSSVVGDQLCCDNWSSTASTHHHSFWKRPALQATKLYPEGNLRPPVVQSLCTAIIQGPLVKASVSASPAGQHGVVHFILLWQW